MYCLHEIIWDYVRCSVFQYILPRDIGGSDPERMAAPRVEEYVTQCFAGTKVEIHLPNTCTHLNAFFKGQRRGAERPGVL